MSQPTPYDAVPYASHAYPGTHPERMFGMARLFGMQPALPSGCRVLELGSAAGGNIMPMAVRYPDSEFVGVDLSAVEIAEGVEHIERFGLTNLTLEARDILEVGDRYGRFDYIMCHGVYSWVPRPVQDEILRLCRTLLRPQGVAYVSYNCLPGWHMRGVIRNMMFYHAAAFTEPAEKIQQARAMLDFLASTMPEGKDAYSVLLKSEAEFLRKMSDYYLFHEHLSPDNEALYFHQFLERAVSADLQFLGEATLQTMLTEQFPKEIQEVLGQISGDIARMEQYMDFVRNRTFRQTLLVHKEVALDRTLDWTDITPFALATRAKAPEGAQLADVSEVVFETDDQTIVTEEPLVKLALAELSRAWPRAVDFDTLCERVFADLDEPGEEARQTLASNLLRCLAGGILEYWAEPPVSRRAGDHPTCWAFTRFQLEQGIERLTTLRHQTADVSPVIRRTLLWMDGTRDRAAIVGCLMKDARDGTLSVSKDEEPITDDTELRDVFEQVYDEIVQTVADQSFLVA